MLNATSENEKLTFKREKLRPTIDFWVQEWKLKDNRGCLFKFLKEKKKNNCNLKFSIQQKYLQERRERHLRKYRKISSAVRPSLKNMLKMSCEQ